MTTFTRSTTGNEVIETFGDRVKGKTIVITGATHGGLGGETALTLARGHPATILLLGRTASKIQPVINEIKHIDQSIDAIFIPIELDSLESVRKAAQEVNNRVEKIDFLINNAGVMAIREYTLSKDGIESQLAINHLSHFLLTNLLLDKVLAAGEGSRIVNVTSDGYMISPVRFDDPNFSDGKEYDMWSGYGQSKAAQILFGRRLAKKLEPEKIQVFSIHPGVIMTTGLGNHVGMDDFNQILDIAIKNTGRRFEVGQPKSIQEGISTCLVALLSPDIAGSTGSYLEDCNVKDVYEYAKGNENEERLWTLSESLVGQKFEV